MVLAMVPFQGLWKNQQLYKSNHSHALDDCEAAREEGSWR
jgi:hypothetical protein